MDITAYFNNLGMDFDTLLIAVAISILGSVLLGAIGRFVFGKRSILVEAVSSAIGILFVYVLNIILRSASADLQQFIAPLPFIHVSGDQLQLFSFAGIDYTLICAELVSMVILAFLMNLIDRFMPKGENVFTWIIFRVLTILLAQVAHLFITWLFTTYLPEGILTYAPSILLGLLIVMLVTGALKLLVGLMISTVNPLIAALYTFFFASIIGRQVTKAVFTTAILSGIVLALEKIGIATICIALGALAAYIPLVIVLVILWYVVYKFF